MVGALLHDFSNSYVSKRVPLVHPALVVGVVGIFTQLIGVDVATVFVEVDFAILLTHVDLELACSAAAFPAVVSVANA